MSARPMLVLMLCAASAAFANGHNDPIDTSIDASLFDLPADHLPNYLRAFPDAVRYACAANANCQRRLTARLNATADGPCWGYELGCRPEHRFAPPPDCRLPAGEQPPTANVDALRRRSDTFYDEADFGYVRQQTRELRTLCEPTYANDSSLECSDHLRFCRARSLRVDFRPLTRRTEPFRYRTDVLAAGGIGGRCRLHAAELREASDHMSALQSWAPELQHFVDDSQSGTAVCDEIVDRPTIFAKIDAAFNMYHHFCDFLNLYAALHVNATHPAAFSTDVQVLVWETFPYRSPFAAVWRVFSRHPVRTLNDVRGRVVCYRNLLMPLLPRMIFGLYYNTPIIKDCSNSGLFRAFSEHVLHRMRIPLEPAVDRRVRITLLARQTKYRNIVNAQELLRALRANDDYAVRMVSFEGMPFAEQLRISRNTDVFVGMHGAGLTHLLFLPRWASLFELYNCNDDACYRDLARLKGVDYVTWTRMDRLHREPDNGEGATIVGGNGEAHAKFSNYRFDVDEFVRLVAKCVAHVRAHPEYRRFAGEEEQDEQPDERSMSMRSVEEL